MAKDPQQDKNELVEEQAVQQHVEEMLGPPPQADKPTPKAVIEPAEEPSDPSPLSDVAKADDEPPKEKLLVIPTSDKQAAVAIDPADVAEMPPIAGETIAPTDPKDSKEATDEPLKQSLDNKSKGSTGKKAGNKLKRFFRKWWHNPVARRLTILGIAMVIAGIVAVPGSRYFILNGVGVRGSASMTVLDDSTDLPLKNVQVSLAGQTAKTDENGNVKLQHIKLGSTKLDIQKRAFADLSKNITIGWGSNPLGNFQIQPTGSQYAIYIKDWLTGKGLGQASASGGEADANADQAGKILLTIDTTLAQQDSINVTIHADGYRDEQISLDLNNKNGRTVRLVISRKDVFVTNRTGHYDVHSIDVDGKNDKLVLAGSGLERSDIVLVQHPTDNEAALVSSRVNAHNSDGYLLGTLTLINLTDNTTQAIAQSEQIQVVGWIGSRLLYVQIAAGSSAADPQRFRLMSYDYKTADKKQLDSANAFNDIMLDGNYVYYAPSSAYQKDSNTGLVQSNADGSTKKTLLDKEVWNIFRVGYSDLNLATESDWYDYTIGSPATPTKLKQAPANSKNRLYVTSPDGKHSLWIDQSDGKGLLINYDTAKQTDTTLETLSGLAYPVKWLTNDVLIYRVHDDQQTADYVLDISGGVSHKITDLYNTPGIDRWYYY